MNIVKNNTFIRLLNRTFSRHGRQQGAAMSEFLISIPALLLLGLGGMQGALMYNAKTTVTYAAFEAARAGSVNHAQSVPMREEFGTRIAPIFGGDGSAEMATAAIARGMLEANDSRYTRIDILSPTQQAFDDFGVENVEGITEIPNTALRGRARDIGPTSGVNIQDANLLKVRLTYGFKLTVPLMDRLLPAVMTRFDPDNADFYAVGRIPVSSVATVRLQSPAREDGNIAFNGGNNGSGTVPPGEPDNTGGATPTDPPPTGGESEQSPEEGQGGDYVNVDPTSPACDSAYQDCLLPRIDDEANLGEGQVCALPDQTNTSPITGIPDYGVDNGSPQQSPVQPSSSSPLQQPSSIIASSIGNPINISTGNKHQHETDIASLPGELSLEFQRHYNSQAAHRQTIMGYGWRHAYQLNSEIHENGNVSIVQSDGRRLFFSATEQAQYFSARIASDGWVEQTKNVASYIIWHRTNGYQLHFSQQGLLNRILAPSGQLLSLSYTNDNFLRQVTDHQERSLTFSYYPNKRLKQVYDPAGHTLRYYYDTQGNLSRVTDANNTTREYHYENAKYPHHLTGITDERGIRYARFAYDEQGRGNLSEHINGVGKVSLEYGDGFTRVTDSLGRESIYNTEQRNGIALVTQIAGPGCDRCGQGDIEYEYNDAFQLTEVRYKDGRIERREYDQQGRFSRQQLTHIRHQDNKLSGQWSHYHYLDDDATIPYKVTRPSVYAGKQKVIEFGYNERQQPITITETGWRPEHVDGDAIRRQITLTYDTEHRLNHIDGPRTDVNDITRIEYDNNGRLSRLIGAEGEVQSILEYNAYGRPLLVESYGIRSRLHYNAQGQISSVERNGQVVKYTYTATGKIASIQQADGQTVHLSYDQADRLTGATDHSGNTVQWSLNTENQLMHLDYASADGGLVTALNDLRIVDRGFNHKSSSTQHAIQRGFSAPAAALQLTDARGNATLYFQDDFGRTVAIRSPEAGTKTYIYDAANNLTQYITPTGDQHNYQYDASNRLIAAERAQERTTLRYNEHSRIAEIKGAHETTQYSYTAEGYLASQTRLLDEHTFTTNYQYSEQGFLTHKTLPNGKTLRYHYYDDGDNVGQLRAITQENFWRQQPILSELNSPRDTSTQKHMTFANGIIRSATFNDKGQVVSIDHQHALQLEYQYNDAGYISEVDWATTLAQHRNQYHYDSSGFLTAANDAQGEHAYQYDAMGNRIMATNGEVTQLALYEKNSNRLLGHTETVISDMVQYNAAGSPTVIGERRYEYDSQQRPIALYINNEIKAKYIYNSRGERIKKISYHGDQETVRYYFYDAQKLVAEANGDGTITQQYLYHHHQPVAVLSNDSIYAVHADSVGAPRSVTDANQHTVWAADYSVFGQAFTQEDVDGDGQAFTLNLRFAGQYYDDEAGTHYNYQRDYDPRTGRYLSSDPLGQEGGMNTYLYANANPVNFIDPLGLQAAGIDQVPNSNPILPNDPLLSVNNPEPTVGLNQPATPAGNAPADIVSTTNELITHFNVYVYNATSCPASGEDPGERAFNRGVELFTADVGQTVTSIHNTAIARVIHTQLLNQNAPVGPSDSEYNSLSTQNIQFSVRSPRDNGVDREYTAIAPAPGPLVIDALSTGITAVDPNYLNVTKEQVEPLNWDNLSGAIMVINSDASDEDIFTEARSLLGGLVKQEELDALLRDINLKREADRSDFVDDIAERRGDIDIVTEGALPALVNLQPLYDKVLDRFFAKMFENKELEKLFDDYAEAKLEYENILARPSLCEPHPTLGLKICDSYSNGLQVRMDTALEKYEDLSKEVKAGLVNQGLYPRHDGDLEADSVRDSIIFEALLLVATGDLALFANGIKAAAKYAVKQAGAKLALKSFPAKKALIKALESYLEKRQQTIYYNILATPIGQRLKVEAYLSPEYIGNHLANFDNGATLFIKRSDLDTKGGLPDLSDQLVYTKQQADNIVSTAGGDLRKLEDAIGKPAGSLDGDELVRIDFDNPRDLKLRISNGNEDFVDANWLPGGKSANGDLQAVVTPSLGAYRIAGIDTLATLNSKGIDYDAATGTVKVYRKMSVAEAEKTYNAGQLQPPIYSNQNRQYVSESYEKAEAFVNNAYTTSNDVIVEFSLDAQDYVRFRNSVIPQNNASTNLPGSPLTGRSGSERTLFNTEGLGDLNGRVKVLDGVEIPQYGEGAVDGLWNLGVSAQELNLFNNMIRDVKIR